MTGIERLREHGDNLQELLEALASDARVEAHAIAEQIERETQPKSDPAADVSMSAYDALPPDDREAVAWVRSHGGLDAMRSEWCSRVPYDRHEQRRHRLLDHIAECETALRRMNGRIEELGRRVSDLTTENAELRKRAMPEGIEWPRYESGEPVMFGGFAADVFGTALDEPIFSVELFENGFTLHGDGVQAFYGYEERVKRPAVPAGDGEPLEAGQTVWDVDGHGPLVVKALPSKGDQLVVLDNGGTNFYRYPEKLTHERPDSWERVEEDANACVCAYFGASVNDCEDCDHYPWMCSYDKAEDLVRRAKALAERDA